MKILRKGDKGSDVMELQSALNRAGYSLTIDGTFGSKTEAAVIDFQTKRNLEIDGEVGTETWEALRTPTNTQLYNAFITCLDAIEKLPEFVQLEQMLYGQN